MHLGLSLSLAPGDLGTLLPILLALSKSNQTSLAASLIWGGLYNIVSGYIFRIPMCVQPMKSIASVALVSKMTPTQIESAGLSVSAIIFLLSITHTITWVAHRLPTELVRGIQLGTGLNLVLNGVTAVLASHQWAFVNGQWMDNFVVAILVGAAALSVYNARRNLSALGLFLLGLVFALVAIWAPPAGTPPPAKPAFTLYSPQVLVPSWDDFRIGFMTAGLGQLALTLLNSVVAVSRLADDLFPNSSDTPVASVKSIGVSVGLLNLVGCWFGSVPYCHGSGGLAAQYRFGARSEVSIVMLGIFKILLGLFLGQSLVGVLDQFPQSILGVMLILAGLELCTVIKDQSFDLAAYDRTVINDRFVVMFVTAGGVVGFKNDGIGFLIGAMACALLYLQQRQRQRTLAKANADLGASTLTEGGI
ncbi:uncharacterized protein BJ171DRAFT_422386 [Polychytrium aggregatum]|uniref:uncharacterized protein n=1 Tax=Polychytrium aggregatum TaxID=110093 RepID=UPI0022FE1E56|nr:uncharacterized protein BJ171DRAFT_422386 [Polychytrium aggregatum]KAI9206232.1 hypothetical protein BJ171DRAFT_422386 [Polychytrium aggregatum]